MVVPDEFRQFGNPWNVLASRWFFEGIVGVKLVPKPGVDLQTAIKDVRTCLYSRKIEHNTKIATCAWMLSERFEPPGEQV